MWNPFNKKSKVQASPVEQVVEQKPEKKFKKIQVAKIVEDRIQELLLSTYVAKIYSESGKEIGKTCFSDKIQYSAFTDMPTNYNMYGRHYSYAVYHHGTDKPERCSFAYVLKEEYEKFRDFKNNTGTLSFEDYNENMVVISTDIIKKIVIAVEDTWEEQVQIYKEIFVEEEVEEESNTKK